MPECEPDTRYRRAVDRLLLVVIAASLLVGVGRLPVHLANYLGIPRIALDEAPGDGRALTHLSAWWGPRELPHRGDDYLAVLERRGTVEAANEVVGAVLLEYLSRGGTASCLVIPEDLELMSADVLRLTLDRADGTRVEKEVPVFDEERVRRVSPVPVALAAYEPALGDDALERLGQPAIDFTYPHGRALLYPPGDAQGGAYVLHTDAARSLILLVPSGSSPVEVVR